MAYAALRVKLADGGPVFFRQTRTGRDGEQFDCLKFRTMVVDAEERLAALHAQTGYEARSVQDEGRPAHHQARASGCAATPSTSCPSSSTSGAAR